MPLAGPRPNPNQHNDEPPTLMPETNAFPTAHPHTASAPVPQAYDNIAGAKSDRGQSEIMRDSGNANYGGSYSSGHQLGYIDARGSGNLPDDGDLGGYGRPKNSHVYEYDNPYSTQNGSSSIHPAASTIGPWDSASQRSINISNYPPVPQPIDTQPISDDPSHLRNKPSISGGLSYIDEEGAYYRSNSQRPASEMEMRGLVNDPQPMGQREEMFMGHKMYPEYDTSPCPFPPLEKPAQRRNDFASTLLFATGLDRLLGMFGMKFGKLPVEQEIERKKHGVTGQRWPVACWTLTAIMTGLMVFELVKNYNATGSVIATKPSFNYMIGPSPSVLINIGARFPPCMKLVPAIPPTFTLPCINDTSNPVTSTCSITEICGSSGFPNGLPNQSWRFFVPIFLHVGIIHLLVNMIAQVTAGAQVEREMGTIPFLIVYFAGGVYGFILGGNFSRPGIPSVGASGALFAINACVLVDLLLHWKYEDRPKLKAFLLTIEFAIGIAIGYIPNAVDGLAHLGGFAVGILLGTVLYPAISPTRRRKFIVWGLRVVALALAIMAFVLTTKNFYTDDPNAACTWCRFLSCIPTSSNNRCSGTGLVTASGQVTRRSWDLL